MDTASMVGRLTVGVIVVIGILGIVAGSASSLRAEITKLRNEQAATEARLGELAGQCVRLAEALSETCDRVGGVFAALRDVMEHQSAINASNANLVVELYNELAAYGRVTPDMQVRFDKHRALLSK